MFYSLYENLYYKKVMKQKKINMVCFTYYSGKNN